MNREMAGEIKDFVNEDLAKSVKNVRSGKFAKDALGDRIKSYEIRETGRKAMGGVPVVIRVDGRGFSKFTKGMRRPFDTDFSDLMVEVAKFLVEQTNASVGYVQSDEISIVLDPFGKRQSKSDSVDVERMIFDSSPDIAPGVGEMMFDGRFQKLTSVVASLATARFIMGAIVLWPERVKRSPPVFDARVFEVPNRREAVAALAWREWDATKNAVSMAARAYFSSQRLQNKSSAQMQEMMFQEHGVNFNDYPARFKRGVYVQRRTFEKALDAETLAKIPEGKRPDGPVMRSETVVLDLPPISKIKNCVDVLLDGADPKPAYSV